MSKVTIAGDVNGTGVFTIAAPNGNTNRTLVLPDEAGTVLTSGGALPAIDGSALTNLPASGLGVGQTWQSFAVGSARVVGTTYYNTTGKPIEVLTSSTRVVNSMTQLTVDGVIIQSQQASVPGATHQVNSFGIIPASASYSVAVIQGGLFTWFELR